jgi:hypothetical protein
MPLEALSANTECVFTQTAIYEDVYPRKFLKRFFERGMAALCRICQTRHKQNAKVFLIGEMVVLSCFFHLVHVNITEVLFQKCKRTKIIQ